MSRSTVMLFILATGVSGCLDRTRINARCEWSRDSTGAIDLNDRTQQLHLYKDIEIAEELAITYADTTYKERFGYYGHGGLIGNGHLRDQCMATLMSTIAATHDLSLERVEQARAFGYRDVRWDIGVLLSFGCLYGLIAWTIVRRIARRFPVDEGWPAFVAPLLASVPVGTAAFGLFALWGGALEAFRIGNGHVSSYRAAKSPWPAHSAALVMAGIVVFLLIGGLHHWFNHRSLGRRGSGYTRDFCS